MLFTSLAEWCEAAIAAANWRIANDDLISRIFKALLMATGFSRKLKTIFWDAGFLDNESDLSYDDPSA